MKVCFFSHSGELGGAERSLLALIQGLQRHDGFSCTVVVPGADDALARHLSRLNVPVIRGSNPWWCYPAGDEAQEARMRSDFGADLSGAVESTLDALRSYQPDVIVSNTIVAPVGSVLASLLEVPHVWHIREAGDLDHGFAFYPDRERCLSHVCDSSVLVTTNSTFVYNHLFPGREHGGKIRVIHTGLPPPQVSSGGAGSPSRPRPVVGMFASIRRSKGHEDVVRAVALLRDRGVDVSLVLAGCDADPFSQELMGLVDELDVRERITRTGFLEDPYPLMASVDVVVTCSRNEALGRVPLEAAYLGRPVVCTASGGHPEMLTDGVTGLAYPAGDAKRLADCIERLLADAALAGRLAGNAKRHVEANFSLERFAEAIWGVLHEAAAAKAPCAGVPEWLLRLTWKSLRDNTPFRRFTAGSRGLCRGTGASEDGLVVCRPGAHAAGHCVHGPGLFVLVSQQLRVDFHLRAGETAPREQRAVSLDVYDRTSGEILRHREIKAGELRNSTAGIPLSLRVERGQELEFRVYWHGGAEVSFSHLDVTFTDEPAEPIRAPVVRTPLKVLNIICAYNERHYLPMVLNYYESQGIDVFVLDNYSTDGTWEWLQRRKTPSSRVDTQGMFHLAMLQSARKAVAAAADADWIIYGDADEMIVPASGGLREYIEVSARQGSTIIRCPMLAFYNTGERAALPDAGNSLFPDRIFRYYAQMPRAIERMHKNDPSVRYDADSISLDDPRILEAGNVYVLNYGATKSRAQQEDILQRRRHAWEKGLNPDHGKHYLEHQQRGWHWDRNGLLDINDHQLWGRLMTLHCVEPAVAGARIRTRLEELGLIE